MTGTLSNDRSTIFWVALPEQGLRLSDFRRAWKAAKAYDAATLTLHFPCIFGFGKADGPRTAAQIFGTSLPPKGSAWVYGIHAGRAWEMIPLDLADEVALIAQRYAGYFFNKTIRTAQYPASRGPNRWSVITQVLDGWTPPLAVADRCPLCSTMTDESVVRRIAGMQAILNRETLSAIGGSSLLGAQGWGRSEAEEKIDNFLRENPNTLQPIRLTELPLDLQRRLCVEVNHAILGYAKRHGLRYCARIKGFFKPGVSGHGDG